MFNRRNNNQGGYKRIYTGLILAVLMLIFTSCGQSDLEEYTDQYSAGSGFPDPEAEYVNDTYEEEESDSYFVEDASDSYIDEDNAYTEDTSDSYAEDYSSEEDNPDQYFEEDTYDEEVSDFYADEADHAVDQVDIPDGTGIVRYTGDREQLYEDMYMETSWLTPEVCLIGGSFDREDMYAMPYSGFWIKDYTTRTETGTDPMTGNEETYTFYRFNYFEGLTTDELARQKEEVDRAAEAIIARIPVSADTWTQIRIVHDELCRLITFDQSISKPHIYDAYGALVNHEAVCNGYACAFNHIMSRLAIDSRRVYSKEHAWSYAGVPSGEVYLDITWDDTDRYDEYGNEYVNYAFLFLPLDEMSAVEDHQDLNGETASYSGYSEQYNYYLHEGYYIYEYNWNDFVAMMRRQYETGTNLLTVRFEKEEDYQMAKSWYGSERTELNDLLRELNYDGTGIYTWYRDDLRTMSIGLYAPKQ